METIIRNVFDIKDRGGLGRCDRKNGNESLTKPLNSSASNFKP